ncbi:MAG: hypothetical protein AAGH92_10520 [Planctomycetota bacterium]
MNDIEVTAADYRRRRLLVTLIVIGVVLTSTFFTVLIGYRSSAEARNAKDAGLAAFDAGRFAEAQDLLARAVEADDTNSDLLTKLALSRLEASPPSAATYADALTLLERALNADADAHNARRALVMVHLKLGRDLDALTHADRLMAAYPRDFTTFRLRTELLAGLRDYDRLLETADEADIHAQQDDEIAVEAFIARSVAFQGLGDVAEAYAWAERALQRDPLNRRAVELWIDRIKYANERAADQVAWLENYAARHPDDPRAAAVVAKACRALFRQNFSEGQTATVDRWMARGSRALRDYMERQAPDDRSTSFLRELDHYGMSSVAFVWLSAGLDADSEAALWSGWAWRAWMYGRLAEMAKRMNEVGLESSTAEWSDDFLALAVLAHRAAMNPEQAETWNAVLAERDSAAVRFWAAKLSGADKVDEARCLAVLEVVPTHPAAAMDRTQQHIAQGEASEARAMLQLLAETYPGWAQPALVRSRLAAEAGESQTALAWAEQARNAEPANAEVLEHFISQVAASLDLLNDAQAENALTLLDLWDSITPDVVRDNSLLRLHLLLIAGRADDANRVLDPIISSSSHNADQMRAVARRAQSVGEYGIAERILTSATRDADEGNALLLDLAKLYFQVGRTAEAQAIVNVQSATFAAEAIALEYKIASQRGDLDAAERLNAAIEMSGWSRTDQLAWIADQHLAVGAWDKASAAFAEAMHLEPERLDAERGYVSTQMAVPAGDWVKAFRQHTPGLAKDPRYAGWQGFTLENDNRLHREALRWALREPENAPLYASWLRDRVAAGSVSGAIKSTSRVEQTAGLAALALLEASLPGVEVAEAVPVAKWAAANYSTEPEVLSQATAIFLRAGDFAAALDTARAWRSASAVDIFTPTLVMADLNLRLGRPVEARRVILPLIGNLEGPSSRARPVAVVLARSWLLTGDEDLAWDVFQPRLLDDQFWRATSAQVAVTFVEDSQVMRAWLADIVEVTDFDAREEVMNLASVYRAAFRRTGDPYFRKEAEWLISAPSTTVPIE